MDAIRPIRAIMTHSFKVGLIQIEGINIVIIKSPTTLVNKRVKRELSEVLNFLVIIKYKP